MAEQLTMDSVRVLLVDDCQALEQLLAQILRANGLTPIHSHSAEDALVVATRDPPDVIVVDQNLPGLSGSEFIRIVRSAVDPRLRGVPIVGLSGRKESSELLTRAGASCFVGKPFHDSELLKAIQGVLRSGGSAPARR